MASTATHPRPAQQGPLLIAVAGLARRTGVSTTAVALTHAWPGPEPAVLVEADPAGGQLAELVGADPYRGLASVSWAAHTGPGPMQLGEHLQYLAGGVGFLAAPPGPDPLRTEWVTMLLTGRDHDRHLTDLAAWRDLGATVIVDCGTPDPALAPVVTAADACLIPVPADLTDPATAGQEIRELARRTRHPGVLLIGAEPDSDYTTALGVPVLACLPHEPQSAAILLRRTVFPRRRTRLLRAARAVAAAVDTQLRPPAPAPAPAAAGTSPTHLPARQRGRARARRGVRPRVYRLELPPAAPPAPERAHTAPPPAPIGVPPVRGEETGTGQRDGLHIDDTERTEHRADTGGAAPPAPVASPDSALVPASGTGPGLVVRVFGPTRLWVGAGPDPDAGGVEITHRLQPQGIELLAVLALHPDGVSRTELLEALWGAHLPTNPSNALNNALHRLRTVIATATGTDRHAAVQLTQGRARYRLHPAHVRVDYWDFTDTVAARRRAATDHDRALACQRIIDIDTDIVPLAPDLAHTWVEPLREAARRDALNALEWLAAHTMTTDPRTSLGLLETATESDPYNEALWQNILRLHATLGEYDALARTYTLLSRKLAEIDATPSRETQQLLHHLQHTTR